MSDEWDLDREIAEVLAGGATPTDDPAVLWLAAAARLTPPPRVGERVDALVADRAAAPRRRAVGRPGPWVAAAAVALGVAFLVQGVGSMVAGRWIAAGMGQDYAADVFFELGLAMVAAGTCAAAGAVSRAWLPVSVLVCAPLGLALALHGIGEFGEFPAGATLHTLEGALAVAFLAAWLAEVRSGRPRRGARFAA
ncbi:MAG TPA: hypothetical protein VNS55_14800 [Nocardioides sp.]|nr:hypothetical protein [Nocardioides sp.]